MKKNFCLYIFFLVVLIHGNTFGQGGPANPRDSVYQRNKTDSTDFRSSPIRSIPDTSQWKTRDSIQIDDRNPKINPKFKTDTFPK